MATVLISYASRTYAASQKRLTESARGLGIDRVVSYSPGFLYTTGYAFRHFHILRRHKGAGYWLWKPYIIARTLHSVPEGDIVLYSDVDHVIAGDLDPLLELACRHAVVLFSNHGRLNRTWTKRDCVVYMGCDTPECHDAEQLEAGQIIVRNTPSGRAFVAEWLRWCEDRRILTDEPNTCGLPDLEGFQAHRHDQSVLSLVARRRQVEVFRSPTQRGNHLKLPEYRTIGECLKAPYSPAPWSNSAYGTLVEEAGLVYSDTRSALRKRLARSHHLRGLVRSVRKWLGH